MIKKLPVPCEWAWQIYRLEPPKFSISMCSRKDTCHRFVSRPLMKCMSSGRGTRNMMLAWLGAADQRRGCSGGGWDAEAASSLRARTVVHGPSCHSPALGVRSCFARASRSGAHQSACNTLITCRSSCLHLTGYSVWCVVGLISISDPGHFIALLEPRFTQKAY